MLNACFVSSPKINQVSSVQLRRFVHVLGTGCNLLHSQNLLILREFRIALT